MTTTIYRVGLLCVWCVVWCGIDSVIGRLRQVADYVVVVAVLLLYYLQCLCKRVYV